MTKIQAILADIDGTLTEGGNIKTVDPSLRQAIKEVRDAEVLFSLASARPWFEQVQFHRLLISPDMFERDEGILYEASCVRLLGTTQGYRLGGLTKEQISEVEKFAAE